MSAREMSDFLRGVAQDLDNLVEGSEGLEAFECIDIEDAIATLGAAVGRAKSMVRTQLLAKLEEPVIVGGKVYSKTETGKTRPKHDVIRKAIVRHSVADEDGEMRDPHEAAERAVGLTYALFVSPSTVPKITPLEDIGLFKKQATRWEHTGYDVTVTDVEPDDDAS